MEDARIDELSANHDKINMETAIEKMRNEKNALLRDLESDHREYDFLAHENYIMETIIL